MRVLFRVDGVVIVIDFRRGFLFSVGDSWGFGRVVFFVLLFCFWVIFRLFGFVFFIV